MGKRGRKPTPSAIAAARGNPGHRPINDEEPQYEPASLKPPKELTGRALQEWKALAPDLIARGVLRGPAVSLFVEYCDLVGEIAILKAKIRKIGLEDARKLKYPHDLHQVRSQMRQYASELGMTPTSSAGVRARNLKRDAPAPATARAQRRARFLGVIDGGQKQA